MCPVNDTKHEEAQAMPTVNETKKSTQKSKDVEQKDHSSDTTSCKKKNPNKDKQARPPRNNNVIIVRKGMKFRTLVILTKDLMRSQFDSIELHGVDDFSYHNITLVAHTLMKYNYCTMTRLKTKTVQSFDDGEKDKRVVLQPRLVIHLQKTAEFDKVYDDFDSVFKKVQEEHKDDIDADNAEEVEVN